MSEMVSVEVGITRNIGDYSTVRLTVGMSETHTTGNKEVHAAKLYAKAKKLVLRKLVGLASDARRSIRTRDDTGD